MKQITLLLFVLITFMANAQVTTSGISGRVKDSKEYLPGATVQAIHQPSGTRYGTITNSDGRFTLQGMRPGGPYEVTISFLGYQTEIVKNIQLRLGESYQLNADLKNESKNLDEVIITAKSGSNASKNGTATNFSIQQLNTMPTVSRSITDITRLTPQAAVNSNGAISFAGANNRYNSFQIDGAMNNDVYGLTNNGTNGGMASTEPVSLETVEQIQVNIAPFDVRQSGFTGGGINAVTKSGTNLFRGSAYFFGNNQGLIGKTPGKLENGEKRERLVKQHDYQWGITVGGPIIKDKLFFYANYENTNKSYPTANNLGDGSAVNQETANKVLAHLQEKTGGKYTGNFDKRDVFTRSHKAGLKIDWNINERNTLSARYSYVGAERLNFSRSEYNLKTSDQAFIVNSKTNSWIVELNSRIKNSMNNELRASYVRVRDERIPEGDPFPCIKIYDGRNTIDIGTDYSSVANRLDQDIVTLTDNFNWLIGNHNLTFGTHNELYFFKNLFIQNLYGSYTFNNVNEFLEDKVKQYSYGQSRIDVTGKADFAPSFGALQVGFYIQDNWNISNSLSLTYGIRMDIPVLLDTPSENAEFNNSEIAREDNVQNNIKPKSTPLWSPRIGFRWFTTESHNQLLRGGVGIFTGRIPFVWVGNSFSNTGTDFLKYYFGNYDKMPQGFYFNTDPFTQYDMLQQATAEKTTEVDVMDKKFKFSQNLRFNLAYEYTLPFGLRATAEALYSKTLNDIVYKDLNIKETGETIAQKYGLEFDNRPMFKNKVNPAYTNVMYLGNTSKGYTYNLSLKLEQSFRFGLDLSAAYTYGESKSLNPGSNSVAKSNWQYNEIIGNPNSPELSFSDFNMPHRIVASVTYSKAYARHFKTTVSMIYTGQSGAPYNVTYNGDLNGDGSSGNDLIFIPTDAQIDQMQFLADKNTTDDEQRSNLKAFLASDKYMKDHRGEYFKRNVANLDFEHHFDVRILQDFSIKTGSRTHTLQLSFDVMNIGNMFNKEWGIESYLQNNSYSPIKYSGNGQFQYLNGADYKPVSVSNISSRWKGQIGIKYIF